jgi:pyruvate/2-oxoglutarate dehydrogenase complex dihydrolipoamide dehydrogenase (E3) component
MKKYDIVIIGGGPAGIVTAMTAQKEYQDKSILIIKEEKDGLVPCGIPYMFHALGDMDKNRMGPQAFVDAGGEVLIDTVKAVDSKQQVLTVSSTDKIAYDKLVFATGSRPTVPNFIKGFDSKYIALISKSYSAMQAVQKKAVSARKIIVLGSGFTAVEMAEQLALETEKEVHLIFRSKNCLHRAFSPEFAEIINQELANSGVILHSESPLKELVCTENKCEVILESGDSVEGDMLIAAMGFEANVNLAASSGFQINGNNHIVVDNYQRTNVENVFAVGDCAQTKGFITGKNDNIMLASTATAEARVLGHNLFKIRIKRNFPGTLSVFATEINKTVFASAGAIEQEAERANISYVASSFSDVDRHPGTFKDAKKLIVKLVVMPEDGQIIGGEVVGSKSSAELINVIALAIQKYVTVYELISFQIGSHPLLSGAPTKTALIKAAESAIREISKLK